jgi:uncharacterized protein YodC (DUF2158 family)
MPTPAAGHAFLERLAGDWTGEETMYPSPWDPKGGTASATIKSQVRLNGFACIGEYEQTRHGVTTFVGHSVFTYDPQADVYTLHWFDGLGTRPEVFTGKRSGESLTVAHGGPGMHARLTYDVTDPAALKSKMEMSKDGVSWQTFFDGRYRRR